MVDDSTRGAVKSNITASNTVAKFPASSNARKLAAWLPSPASARTANDAVPPSLVRQSFSRQICTYAAPETAGEGTVTTSCPGCSEEPGAATGAGGRQVGGGR